MAKGQHRSNREAKKPKKEMKPVVAEKSAGRKGLGVNISAMQSKKSKA